MSSHWALARRGILKIWPDRATCGDWTLPFDQIDRALVYTGLSPLGRTRVLMLSIGDEIWQFSVNPWANPVPHLPFRVEERKLGGRGQVYNWFMYGIVLWVVLNLIFGR